MTKITNLWLLCFLEKRKNPCQGDLETLLRSQNREMELENLFRDDVELLYGFKDGKLDWQVYCNVRQWAMERFHLWPRNQKKIDMKYFAAFKFERDFKI
jgi:hypothetical protein